MLSLDVEICAAMSMIVVRAGGKRPSARRGAERVALCGLSMSGYVALEIMRRAPDRVQKLALLDTQARPMPPSWSCPVAAI